MSWFTDKARLGELRMELEIEQASHMKTKAELRKALREKQPIIYEASHYERMNLKNQRDAAREAAQKALQERDDLQVRATQLAADNAALQAALLTLGGAVIKL